MALKLLLIAICAITFVAKNANSMGDIRVCGEPARNIKGEIIRRADVLQEFQKLHPCPITGKLTGACVGWSKDHVIPLACGGCDAVENLQWLPNPIKSASGVFPKDRWERKIYCNPIELWPKQSN